MSQQPRLTYRPDIDGLRAIAVLAVIGFHASPRFVPGGFVGVDVFFVISGFLISGILFAQASAERFSFADFYARRVRRIFPALAVVLVGCWAIGWLVLVGGEYRQLEKHIAAGATFLSNFLLWGESGYFDAAAESKPLLHLWSLGVEEQFYLMWPPILYFCWKRGLNMVTAIVAIVAGSFLLNVSLVGWNAIAAFYAPLTRLWELLLGGLLAYGELFHRARITSAVNEVVFVSVDRYDDRFVANLKAGLGLTLIALAVALLGKNAAYPGWWFSAPAARPFAVAVGLADGALYPGWWALLPVVGTALLIWAGPDAAINRRLLALRVLVYIGLISYPLYLWHWPLLSFARIMESGEAPRSVRAAAIGIAFILAAATYEAVERPIRRGVSRRTPLRLATVAAALAVVASISFYSYETDAFTSRTPQFATAVDPPMRSPRHDPRCGERFPTEGEYCQEYAPGLPVTAALIGDSHAEHFLNGVGAFLRDKGQTVVHLGESGCPPLFDVERATTGVGDTCRAAGNSVLNLVANRPELRTVILSFRGAVDVSGTGFGETERELRVSFRTADANLAPPDAMKKALARTVEFLLDHGKTVWLLLQVPELDFRIDQCVGRPVSFSHHVRIPCAVPKAEVVERQGVYRQIVREVNDKLPALHVFDPMRFLCDDRWCYAVVDHVLLYLDNNHLSRAGSLFFADKFTF